MGSRSKTRSYITSHFAVSLFTLFLPFFLIVSLVYLVKIASLTAHIRLSLQELLLLYGYSLPDILFYTLPLSFIAALATMLLRLSKDNELIALYSLGFGAKHIVHSLFIISFLLSLFLLVISLLAMPTSKQLYKSFKHTKKANAKLNLVPGRLGQKFGDYYIYVASQKGDVYRNIVIYNRNDRNKEQFFASRSGQIQKQNTQASLLLQNGYGYTYTATTLRQAKYRSLEVFDTINIKPFHYQNALSFWKRALTDKKTLHRLLFYIFISLIPLLSVHIIAAFSMINPRYQSGHPFILILSVSLGLYLIASALQKWGTPLLLILSIVLTLILGMTLFKTKVQRYF